MEEIKHIPSHLPKPSFWPIVLAFGLVVTAIGVIFTLIISAIGALIVLGAITGWVLENRTRYGNVDEGDEE